MIFIYRLTVNIIYGVLYPYAWYKMVTGSEMWRDRLGKADLQPCDIWLHASSVGEVTIISYLASWLKSERSALRLHVTTMTASGFATAKKRLSGQATISYFPIDKRSLMRRTLAKLKPKMVVIAETEIWPNLILECGRREIGMAKVNGRISPKAFRKYLWVRRTIGGLIARYDRIICKTADDLTRYRELGATASQAVLGGDMKFDAPLIEKTAPGVRGLRQSLGIGDHEFLFVCGSTRPGEEAILLGVYQAIRQSHGNFRMLLAPRHLERLDEVRELIGQSGLAVHPVGSPLMNGEAVLLVEQMGILSGLYGAADLAFVGGTLVDIGGHNLLEPVWAQTPVIYGTNLSNVREAAAYIETHQFGACVQSAAEMVQLISKVISGIRIFKVKTVEDVSRSSVAAAGQYILGKLGRG